MANLEYSDFHKFKASIGVAVIASSGLLPWFILKEPFDLYIESDKLKLLTPVAREIIQIRQIHVKIIVHYWPWISFVLFGFGVALLINSFKKWQSKQAMQDKADQMTFENLEKSQKLSQKQILDKGLEEIQETIYVETHDSLPKFEKDFTPFNIQNYVNLEQKIIEQLKITSPNDYELLERRFLGGREFDAIVAHKSGDKPDVIIELKFTKSSMNRNQYFRIRDHVRSLTLDYTKATGRKAVSLIIVVTENGDFIEHIKSNWNVREELFIPILIIEKQKLDKLNFADVLRHQPELR